MLNLSRFRARRLAAIGFALTTAVGVLILPSTPSGANPIYSPTPDPGTVPIIYTVNTIQHITVNAAEATTWPPVIGQTDYVRWDFNLQEDITGGKVVVDFTGPNNVPISFEYPVCGTPAKSRTAVIPASGPNVWAGPFVWPVGTPVSTDPAVSCPIVAGDYDTGLVPFTIPDTVQPGTYSGTVQVADQTGGVIFKTSWQMVLNQPAPTTLTLSASPNPATFGSPVTFTGTLSGGLASPSEPLGSISLGAYTDPSCHNLAFTLGVDNNVNAGNGTYTIGTTTPAAPGTYYGSAFFADSDGLNSSASSGSCQPILVVNQAPAITSANTTTFTVGKSGSFSVTATGSPTPSLSEIGALPGGVTFTDNHNGTATLAGTPKPLTAGTYVIPITASNGVSPDATQTFTLVVVQPGQVNLAMAKGSNVGCTVTWSGHSIGAIGSYEAFTFTSTPASSPSSVGPANAAHGVHPGATVTSVEHLTPGTMSASLVFHAVNNYGQQQTINLTIPTPGC